MLSVHSSFTSSSTRPRVSPWSKSTSSMPRSHTRGNPRASCPLSTLRMSKSKQRSVETFVVPLLPNWRTRLSAERALQVSKAQPFTQRRCRKHPLPLYTLVYHGRFVGGENIELSIRTMNSTGTGEKQDVGSRRLLSLEIISLLKTESMIVVNGARPTLKAVCSRLRILLI